MVTRSIGFTDSIPRCRIKMALLFVLIFVGVLVRLYGIDAPPFDHHWLRQYDTAAIARNFSEESMNILYPQVDWRGDSPGYVEVEFQIYTFLVAILYRVFGLHEWLGRTLNIAFYALSAFVLFRFARRLLDDRIALFAVFFYSFVPLSFFFTRSFQPDALMALCSLVGVYYFWVWTEGGRWASLALSAFGISLAILIKPMNVYLGLPLLYLSHRKFGWQLFRKPVLWSFAALVCLPSLLWYFHAFSLWKTYGNTFFRGYTHPHIPPLIDWLRLLGKELILNRLVLIAPPPGTLLLLIGFFTKPPRRNYLLHWWTAGFAFSILLAFEGHYYHDYYQLPIVFVTAICMAFGMVLLLDRKILSRVVIVLLCVAMIGFSAWYLRPLMTIEKWHLDRVTFGERVSQFTEPDALIIFATVRHPRRPDWYQHRTAQGEYLYHDPVDFYLSHRKGWSVGADQLSPEFLEILRQRGAEFFATYYHVWICEIWDLPKIFEQNPELKTHLDRYHTPVELTSKWAIYRLDGPSSARPSADREKEEAKEEELCATN